MSRVEARFLLRRNGGFTLDIALSLPATGVSVLFGPSGCGKTTVLRCLAGLARAETGRLAIGDSCWQDSARGIWLPTHRRPIGYVFQEASLFPHLSVAGNLAFARRRGEQPGGSDAELIALLGLGPLLDRRPGSLSGGERQRVAIARALATGPRVLLMDEPLAALDAGRKAEILPYLEQLHAELSIPMIYVTHSMDEVVRLADWLVAMEGGRSVASGPVAEVLVDLDSPLARADEASVALDARVVGHDSDYGLSKLDIGGIELWMAGLERPVGSALRIRIHARDVSLALYRPDGSSITNILPSVIEAIAGAGDHQCIVKLRMGNGARLLARITRRSRDLLGLTAGAVVYAQIKGVVPIN
ncbi:MAG: molybdenum ABC transporter ATP-binding protein [Rhodocyclaceae bacterium]|nr:molybdenum ABC transporter ATP-binding protein [Rhodocyclaceae bacterium]